MKYQWKSMKITEAQLTINENQFKTNKTQ